MENSEYIEVFSKKINLFLINFFNETKNNWRNNNNNLNSFKKKNYIISLINKVAYINKNNYNESEIYKKDVENQKRILTQIKQKLNEEENVESILYDIFFETKQDMLFIYTKDNSQVYKFGSNTNYSYILEKIIFKKKYFKYINNIYNIIIEKFFAYDFALLDNDLSLTNFTKIFLNKDIFNNINTNEISQDYKQEVLELVLDIKNKLQRKALIFFLFINLMIKYKIINFKSYYKLLKFIKRTIINILENTTNIIYQENLALWSYYFIINNILYNNKSLIIYINNKQQIDKIFNSDDILNIIFKKNSYLKYL